MTEHNASIESSEELRLPDRITVGSYFLETLTTGMYEDPFHCIREYVQNSFDAITDGIATGVLRSGEGRVTVAISGPSNRPTLSIRDNGTGIPVGEVVERLLFLGVSRKQPLLHAGFRGIGRLAGIAYCSVLKFTTKLAGEKSASIVEFDCGKLRGFMKPGAEPKDVSDVVRSSVLVKSISDRPGDHYTEVEMSGLFGQGLEFTQPERLGAYLSEYCPVDYADSFEFGDRVRAVASGFGASIPAIEVELKNRRDRIPIRKAYRNNYPTSVPNSKSTLYDIVSFSSKEHGWFCWFGLSNFPGEITDETIAGVRFRMKNIQIGDEAIIEEIASRLTISGTERRLQRWAVGEIFITNTEVIPNARRDGFEDNAAWRNIQADIQEIADRIIKLIREASKNRSKIKKAIGAIEATRSRLNVAKLSKKVAGEVDKDLRKQLNFLQKVSPSSASPKQVSQLIAQIKELMEQLDRLRIEEEPPPPPPRKPMLDIVQEVLVEHLGPKRGLHLMSIIRERISEETA